MSLSNFEWIIVYNNGETEKVVTDEIEEVVLEYCKESQPVAIIRGELR